MICLSSTYLVYENFFKNKSFVQEESETKTINESVSISQSEEIINSEEKEKNLISNLKNILLILDLPCSCVQKKAILLLGSIYLC